MTSPNTVYNQNYRNNYNLCVLISVFYDMDIPTRHCLSWQYSFEKTFLCEFTIYKYSTIV